jgi:hypothetical protein
VVGRSKGESKTGLVAKAISRPSGDQAGFHPRSAIRRTNSPVMPMTKRPPESREERKAIVLPSGENAGWTSSLRHSRVRLTGRCPPTSWR